MHDGELNRLIDKYLSGTATASEAKLVDNWYASFDNIESNNDTIGQEEIENKVSESFKALLSHLNLQA